MQSSLNFFTCANRPYEDFTPLFAASCLWSNPGTTVEVGVESPQTFMQAHGRAIDALREHVPTGSVVIRGGQFRTDAGRKILPNSVRFVTAPEVVSDYVYISDIDIITLDADILGIHLQHMDATGLPFSNVVTRSERPRLSGLHFTRYDALYPLPAHDDLLTIRINDEALLYVLVERKTGPIPDAEGKGFRPVHGIHVSPNRAPYVFQTPDGRTKPGWLHGHERKHQERWREFRNSPLFTSIEPHLNERITGIVWEIDNFHPSKLGKFGTAAVSAPSPAPTPAPAPRIRAVRLPEGLTGL